MEEGKALDSEHGDAPKKFDFFAANHSVLSRMPALQIVNERFIRNVKISFFGLMKKGVEISGSDINLIKFGEYIQTLSTPTSINSVKVKPLRGLSLFVMDEKLVYVLVDNFFGGMGIVANKVEGRSFTPTENRIVQMVLNIIFQDLKNAWSTVLDVDFLYQNSEMNPMMINVISPSEVIVLCKFKISIEGAGGEFHIVFPYSMLEPIKDSLDKGLHGDRDSFDENWVKKLHDDVFGAQLEIKSILCKKELKLSEIDGWKTGDIIPIDFPEYSVMYADSVPTFKVKLGQSDDKYALRIIGTVLN